MKNKLMTFIIMMGLFATMSFANIEYPKDNDTVGRGISLKVSWDDKGTDKEYLKIYYYLDGKKQRIFYGYVTGTDDKLVKLPIVADNDKIYMELNDYKNKKHISRSKVVINIASYNYNNPDIVSPIDKTKVTLGDEITVKWENYVSTSTHEDLILLVRYFNKDGYLIDDRYDVSSSKNNSETILLSDSIDTTRDVVLEMFGWDYLDDKYTTDISKVKLKVEEPSTEPSTEEFVIVYPNQDLDLIDEENLVSAGENLLIQWSSYGTDKQYMKVYFYNDKGKKERIFYGYVTGYKAHQYLKYNNKYVDIPSYALGSHLHIELNGYKNGKHTKRYRVDEYIE